MTLTADPSQLRAHWRESWFAPSTPDNLGLCRLLYFALLLVFHLRLDYSDWGRLTPTFANNTIPLFRWLHLKVFSATALNAMQIVWKLSMFTACIGLLTRSSVFVSFILGTYLLGLPHNFGKQGHGEGVIVLTNLILLLSRCGDAWSVDSLLRHKRGAPRPPPSLEYTWPIRMVWLVASLIFFASGMAKLRLAGLDWITSDSLSIIIQQHYFGEYSRPPFPAIIVVADWKILCRVIAAATIIVELGFPLALFSVWCRRIFVTGMFLAQLSIYVLMGVNFAKFMSVYLFFVPWDRVADRVVTRGNRDTIKS